jgi:hypothetical protein
LAWGCGLDSTGSGQGQVAGCCECGDEPSGSCATELVRNSLIEIGEIRYWSHKIGRVSKYNRRQKNSCSNATIVVSYHNCACSCLPVLNFWGCVSKAVRIPPCMRQGGEEV